MHLQESILCATAPSSSSNAGPGAISLHDIQTGSTLASFKQTNAGPHCTAFVESRNAQGGFMLAAQPDKSILNVYTFQKDQLSLKIVLPEKLTCITTDSLGEFCAGGTVQGRIYLWEVASGILYHSWDAHYRQVTVLRFTLDGAALISGSEDSGVSVWSVSRLIDDDLQTDLPIPYCTLSDHTLPVTDIVCGIGSFPNCRVLTSSIDHSVKLWDLSSRSLLTTFQFPQPITHLAWDLTERIFLAASSDGSIHQMNLFRHRDTKKGGQFTEAIGGAGISDIIRVGEEDRETRKKRLISVGQPVTAVAISLTSSHLLVGTEGGLIHVYDIPSHQLLRTISTHKGLTITYLATMLKPPDLVGHINLSLTVGSSSDTKDVIPVKPISPFQRMRDPKTREAHDIAILLPPQRTFSEDEASAYDIEELLRDHAFFVQPSTIATSPGTDTVSLKMKIDDLETEVAQLREQLGKAKSVNDAMWDTVVQRALGQSKDKESVNGEDGERRRKRGRI
ncbi:Pre-rRNA-processing protein IPI3 [Hypsizygus marmoreus]|uniref:Pre-rRNA-processing protein IPI3 n=1 Tax=Hypsizygus marmoreus TaxID=39966 RepID=A0A369JQC4_HYPMA|nr:Pre-rRNA-processing protein IPI3 [Hypsizygus marmoreus]